ncbi:cell division cycle and apoptosis regulator protein [Anaeramoeba flamelloides]|uniref:Cell division cycle and apoptosis regulator protein n=1 Tax=Anaeramoeba flamelloides TaxID=1746091 RepID=A0AAV8AI18_9EUKA|nr:cell division cycle and apoptosis regulator protein [Anaeramoeba flamelloides]
MCSCQTKEKIYQSPRNIYELFVNCYYKNNKNDQKPDKIFSMAQTKWKDLKRNRDLTHKYLNECGCLKELLKLQFQKKNKNSTSSKKSNLYSCISFKKKKIIKKNQTNTSDKIIIERKPISLKITPRASYNSNESNLNSAIQSLLAIDQQVLQNYRIPHESLTKKYSKHEITHKNAKNQENKTHKGHKDTDPKNEFDRFGLFLKIFLQDQSLFTPFEYLKKNYFSFFQKIQNFSREWFQIAELNHTYEKGLCRKRQTNSILYKSIKQLEIELSKLQIILKDIFSILSLSFQKNNSQPKNNGKKIEIEIEIKKEKEKEQEQEQEQEQEEEKRRCIKIIQEKEKGKIIQIEKEKEKTSEEENEMQIEIEKDQDKPLDLERLSELFKVMDDQLLLFPKMVTQVQKRLKKRIYRQRALKKERIKREKEKEKKKSMKRNIKNKENQKRNKKTSAISKNEDLIKKGSKTEERISLLCFCLDDWCTIENNFIENLSNPSFQDIGPLTIEILLKIKMEIRKFQIIDINDLLIRFQIPESLSHALETQLLCSFPTILMKNNNRSLLLNLECLTDNNVFFELIKIDKNSKGYKNYFNEVNDSNEYENAYTNKNYNNKENNINNINSNCNCNCNSNSNNSNNNTNNSNNKKKNNQKKNIYLKLNKEKYSLLNFYNFIKKTKFKNNLHPTNIPIKIFDFCSWENNNKFKKKNLILYHFNNYIQDFIRLIYNKSQCFFNFDRMMNSIEPLLKSDNYNNQCIVVDNQIENSQFVTNINSNNSLIVNQKHQNKNKNETKNNNQRLITKETDQKKSIRTIDKIIDKIVEKKKLEKEKDKIILNNQLKNHSDPFLCYYHTQVRYIIELFIRYQKHCQFISCSNFRFNSQSQDHNGSVYINHFLKIPNNNNIQYTYDHLNRKHITMPLEGESYTINRNIKYNPTSIETVANDLYNILNKNSQKNKSILSILVDYNETETNPRSFLALIYFGRLWKKLKLDILNVCCYSSEHDYLNPAHDFIQSLKSDFNSKFEKNNRKKSTNDQKNKKKCKCNCNCNSDFNFLPRNQNQLSHDDGDDYEDNEIKNVYFQKSNDNLKEISNWINSLKYQKFYISSTFLKCQTMEYPFHDLDLIRIFLNFHQTFAMKHQLFDDFIKEMNFLYNHVQRRPNMLSFIKCQNLECEHCSKFPMKNNDFIKFLKSNNFQIPFPIQSKKFPNHYYSLLNLLSKLNLKSSTRSSNSNLNYPLIPENIQKKLFEENQIISSIINKNAFTLNNYSTSKIKRKRIHGSEENNIFKKICN